MAWLLKETEFDTFIGKKNNMGTGREWGGEYLRMHKQGGDESQLTKNGQLFSSRSCSYLCPRVHRRRIVSSL